MKPRFLFMVLAACAAFAVQTQPSLAASVDTAPDKMRYEISVVYSSLAGLNKEEVSLMDRGQLEDEQQCLAAVKNETMHRIVRAQTAYKGMKDAVVRCVRLIYHECDGFLSSCASKQELGRPVRLHVFSDGGLLPSKDKQLMAGATVGAR